MSLKSFELLVISCDIKLNVHNIIIFGNITTVSVTMQQMNKFLKLNCFHVFKIIIYCHVFVFFF